MDDFEEFSQKAYPLWLKCLSNTEWKEVSDEDLPLVSEFVGRCVAIAMHKKETDHGM